MTFALALSLVALAVSVAALLKGNKVAKGVDEALCLMRADVQAMRDAADAAKIRKAEAGMSQAAIDETIIK